MVPQCGAAQTTPAQPIEAVPVIRESTIHEMPVLPEMSGKTQESMEKVSKLMEEGEKYFTAKQLDKALTKWQEAYGMSIEMRYTEGEGQALTNMCRFFLERGQMVKAKYMGRERS